MRENIIKMILITVCLLSFLWLSRAILIGYYPDFRTQYFSAASIFSGNNPYIDGANLFTQQVYPPTTSMFYIPFTLFPIEISQVIFTALSIASLVVVFILLSKTFNISFFSNTNILIMTLAFIAFPSKFTLGMGQINMFVLLLMAYGLWLIKQKKELSSGIMFGAALSIKLFPIPVIPLLIVKKKIFLGVLLVGVILVSLTFLFIPISYNKYFAFEILPTFFMSWKLDYYNQALSGFIGRELGVSQISTNLRLISTLAILAISYFAVFRNKGKDVLSFALKFGLLITTSLMINTFSWQHHFVWLVIPYYVITVYLRKNKRGKLFYIFLFISYILVSINFPNPNLIPEIFRSHVFFGTLLLWLVNLYLLRSEKR